jgi:hypothetical protein
MGSVNKEKRRLFPLKKEAKCDNKREKKDIPSEISTKVRSP